MNALNVGSTGCDVFPQSCATIKTSFPWLNLETKNQNNHSASQGETGVRVYKRGATKKINKKHTNFQCEYGFKMRLFRCV